MHKDKVTKEEIFEAADELERQGINPTLARVRNLIGRGSFTTISEVMKEWREKRGNKDQKQEEFESIPKEILGTFQSLNTEIWEIACKLARENLNNEHKNLSLLKEQVIEHEEELKETISDLEEEIKILKLELEQTKEKLLDTELDFKLQKQKITTEDEKLEAAQKQVKELQEDKNKLIQSKEKDRVDLATALGKLEVINKQSEVVTKECNDLRLKNNELSIRVAVLESEKSQLEAKLSG